jgi:predicted GNAT family N-acyltransferase
MHKSQISIDEIELAEPLFRDELQDYFKLRWLLLRAPWGQPLGSEKDEYDEAAHHIAARTHSGELVGVGRVHFSDPETGQIRYLATKRQFRGRGIGKAIVKELEQVAKTRGVRRVILNARDSAVSFYEELGYVALGDACTLFGEIKHKKMEKMM